MTAEENELRSLKNADAWINSQAIKPSDLKGKVVLIQFGTYTCINWLRTLPYTRGWAEKYKKNGLVVIAIHTPEFGFEKKIENIRRALKDLNIGFPVAVDNKYDIWNAFDNHYWPALYLLDKKGNIRHHQFGEGGYEKSEEMIQELLGEVGANDISKELLTINGTGVEVGADWSNLNSAENYLGSERTENFVAPDISRNGRHKVYVAPAKLDINQWGIAGEWTVESHLIRMTKANGRILYQFHARDVNLVMGPVTPGIPIRFRVLIDGKPPVGSNGIDVDEQGYGTIEYQRMYQLIRLQKPISDHRFEIEFLQPGVEAFAFTFG